MLDDTYLLHGLDALSRGHRTDYFADGHRGAAIIAAYFFSREVHMDAAATTIVRGMIDRHWTNTPLCAPFPKEPIDPNGTAEIIECMGRSMDSLRQVGHNVILPTLALRAFRERPDAVTPSRVAGICALTREFTASEPLRLEEQDDIPDLGPPAAAAEFILSELLEAIPRFDGRGQGWSGHLVTYGRALLDLRQLGHEHLARRAEYAFKLYIKRIRMGPLDIDKPRPEHPASELRPCQTAYWEGRSNEPVGLGHVFKYPYGFCGLTALAQDADLKQRCVQVADHIF